jgi:ABC-type transport system involved in cytochrome bd biosynthesis fused ATPase/permease subunit
MLIMRIALVLLILLQTAPVFSQTAENTGSTLNTETATNFLKIITNKFHKLENNLTNTVDKYLTNLEKQENKLYKKLYKKRQYCCY